jgi:hypothetical protein
MGPFFPCVVQEKQLVLPESLPLSNTDFVLYMFILKIKALKKCN